MGNATESTADAKSNAEVAGVYARAAERDRNTYVTDICYLGAVDRKAAIKEIGQMLVDLMDATEQTGIDEALTDAQVAFETSLQKREETLRKLGLK